MHRCTDLVKFTKGGCTGHLTRFDNCLTQALHELTLDGLTAVEEFGDSANWHGYFWVFMLKNSVSTQLADHADAIVLVPPGGYLLRQYPDGHVRIEAQGDYPAVTREADMWARKWEHEY